MSNNIKVSVCIPTYNQANFIERCIESAVSQELDFRYEILVGDDASTDGTQEKILLLAEKHPAIIKAILRKTNLGPGENIADLYRKAKGQYIAHLDGDDYMLPGKLARQIEILDSENDVVICSHDVVRNMGGREVKKKAFCEDSVLNISDLYRSLPFFAHSSKVFRNEGLWGGFYFIKNTTVDFELHLIQAEKGKIYHIADFLGGYNESVGVSFRGGRVNPVLPNSTRRVFDRVLVDNNSGLSVEELKKIYASKMFAYAFHSGRLNQLQDARLYSKESINIVRYSPLQLIFYCSTFSGFLFPIFSKIYAAIKDFKR